MKRYLIVFIILFICFVKSVYGEELIWFDEEIEPGMISEERYRFYTLEKDGEYILKGVDSDYKYEDVNVISYSNYTDWKEECLYDNLSYEVEYGKEYMYQELKPIHYIKIFNSSNNGVKINGIKTYSDNFLLDHEIYSYGGYLKESNKLQPMGHIMLYFPTSVKIDELKVGINFDKESDYEIFFSEDRNFNNLVAYSKGKSIANEYVYNDNYVFYENYSNVFIGYNIKENDLIKVLDVKDVCREREVRTFRYNIKKIYYDENYYKDIDSIPDIEEDDKNNLIKDEENVKKYYRYKTLQEIEDESVNKEDISNIKLVKTGVLYIDENNKFLIKSFIFLMLSMLSLFIIKKCR